MYVHYSMPHLCNSISVLIYCNVTSLFKYAKTFKEKPTHKRDPYNDTKPMEKCSPFMAPLFKQHFPGTKSFISLYLLAHGQKIQYITLQITYQ